MARRIQLRRDTASNWSSTNPTLAQGEIGLDLTNKKIKIGDGVTSWNTLAYWDDNETNIDKFGEGFSLTDTDKIVTNKLFSTNLTQPNQRYRLELDTNGVVKLPDGSIINGATLKTIAGNYAGITAGPASPAGKDEDSWMWVDNNGATIATEYSTNAHTWTFNNDGALTFPQGTTIATADGTDAFLIDGAVDKDVQIYTYSGPTPTAHGWTFGADGTLTLPAGGTINNTDGIKLVTDRGTLAIGTNMETPGVAGHFHIAFDDSNSNSPASDLFLGDDYNYVKLPGYELNPVDYGVEIGTNDRDGGGDHTWRFGTDGSITFPDDTVQTTAYTGQGGGTTTTTDLWIAAGSGPGGSAILHSTDGATWITQDFVINGQSIDSINRVAISSDRIVYLMDFDGPGSAIYHASAPEDTPTLAVGTDVYGSDSLVYWSEINYLGGKFVAVGSASYNGNTVSSSITAVTLAGGGRTYPRITLSNINYNFSGETITITGAVNTELNGTFVLEYNSLDTLRTGVYDLTLDDSSVPTITSTDVTDAAMDDLTNIDGRIPIFAYSTDGVAWTYGDLDPGYVESYGGPEAELEMSDVAYDGTGYLIPVTSDQFGEFGDGGAPLIYGPGAFYITDLTAEAGEGQFIDGNSEPGGLPGNFNNIAAYADGTFFVSDDQYTVWTGNPNIGWTPHNITSALVDAYGWEPETNDDNNNNDVDSAVAGTVGGTEYWVGTTNAGMVISTSDQCDTFQVSIPDPYTSSISDIIRGTTTTIIWSGIDPAGNGEKIVITGVTTQEDPSPGTTNQSYNGTYYIKSNMGDYELYTDSALTTPWDTTGYWPVNQNTGTITWGHGEDLDSIAIGDGVCVVYSGEADKLYRSTDLINWTAFSINGPYGVDDIYYGTRTTTTSNTLVNGDQTLTLNADGSVTFPDGSIQTTAYTGTSGDANVWVQTFESVEGAPDDVVAAAMSVEYDVEGNLVCLFSHALDYNSPFGGTGSYFSVAKISTAGTILWQKRLGAGTYTDGWGLAVDSDSGSVYIAGSNLPDNESQDSDAMLTKIDLADGAFQWSKIYQVAGLDGQSPVVDVASDGNPVMVSYFEDGNGNYIATTKVDSTDGSVIWSRKFDGQGYDYAYGMGVGANGEVVTVGYIDQYTDVIDSYSVTTQTGSGVEVLVINRSDLSNDTFTTSWKVAGSGITGYADVTFINSYSGLTGTVQQGTGATFTVTNNGNGTYAVQTALAGTNYLAGHKIKILGTDLGGATPDNDCIITVDTITLSGGIVDVNNSGTAAGTQMQVYSDRSGTNHQTGSGLVFSLSLDSGSTYTEHPYTFQNVGTNYVTGDVVTISGTQLGGTSPANDLTAVVTAFEGGVTGFNTFSGAQQTTTYRIIVAESEVDFSADGTWTLNNVDVDYSDRMLVIKYNSAGAIQWQKAIQFDADYDCNGADCDIDSEGNIYVTGQYRKTNENGVALSILKLNSSGVKQWSRRVTGNCDTFGTSIVVGADNCLYLSGITGIENPDENGVPYADTHSVLAKYSTAGTVLWQRLLENSSTWSFTGAFFQTGASNLAVKDDYVALSGGYGDFDSTTFSASVAQVSADGTAFSVGEWDFVAANFSGTFFDDASDLTVVDADKTDSDFIGSITVTEGASMDPSGSDFLIGTVYREVVVGEDRLVSNSNELVLQSTGTVTLPKGGTISEGIVTSNPTIQLTPADPDVASQKLVIKGGFSNSRSENGITVSVSEIDVTVGDTITVNVYSGTRANQLLYWWIYPQDAGISIDSESGTVILDEFGEGDFTILVDSDDYEFTVRVSPENNNYDPDNVGVESLTINSEAPAYASPYHLHLTTGDLSETSIFLGTDNHNVRTTVDGGIQITTQTTDVEPATIIITGADVSAINSTYVRAPANPPTWTDSIGIGQDTPYIQFVDGEWGIFAPAIDLVLPIYINTGTLYEPLAQWNTNPPLGSVAPTGVYIYDTPDVHEWTFGIDGALTLPTGGHIGPSGGKGEGTTYGGANDHLVSLTSYYNSGLYSSCVTAYADGTLNITAYNDGGPNPAKIWTFDNTSTLTLPDNSGIKSSTNIDITIDTPDSSTFNWRFGADGDLTFPDNTVQTTAYTGNTTVAKDGPTLPTTSGVVETLNHDSVLTGLTDGTYGPFTRDVVTFSVIVASGVINSFSNITVSGDLPVNAVIGTISGGDISETAVTTTWTSPTDFPGYGGGPMGSGCVLTGPGSSTGRINIKLTDPAKQTAWLALAIGAQVTVAGTGIIGSPLTLDLTGVSGQDGDFYYQEFSTPGALYQNGVSSINSVSFTQGGNTTITITVASVVQATPVAIDLTKTVNKLADGSYTLANGTEGQILYLVMQNGTVPANVSVLVANSRNIGVGTLSPFSVYDNSDDSYYDNIGGFCTLIFTDGAWQQSGGAWGTPT